MALTSTLCAMIYNGNGSTSTPYVVPFARMSNDDVKVRVTAAGTGTVAVAAGVATFSSAQSTLIIGSKVRIGLTIYEIASRTSDTVFSFKDRPTISASAFHILGTDTLGSGDFTLTGSSEAGGLITGGSITTTAAVPITSLVTIFRSTPATQPAVLPEAGAMPTETLEQMADRHMMVAQEVISRLSGDGVGLLGQSGGAVLEDSAVFANAAARTAAKPKRVGQLGVQVDTGTIYIATALAAGAWSEFLPEESITNQINASVAGAFLDAGIQINAAVAGAFLDAGIYTVPNAVGDGVTDDRPAIQAVLDAAGAAGGGTVFLGPGTFKLTSVAIAANPAGVPAPYSGGYFYLQIPPGVTLAGAGMDITNLVAHSTTAAGAGAIGAVITAKGAINAVTAYGGGSNVTIRDFTVESYAQVDESGILLNVCHCDGFNAHRVRINGCYFHGLEWNQSRRGRFIDCVFSGEYSYASSGSWVQFDVGASGPKSTAVTGVATMDVIFDRCRFEQRPATDSSFRDIDMAHTTTFTVDGVKFIDCELTGRNVSGSIILAVDSGQTGASVDNIQMVRCKFVTYHPGAYAIFHAVPFTGTGSARNWLIEDCVFTGSAKIPLRWGAATNATVTGHDARRNFVMRDCRIEVDPTSWTSAGTAIGALLYTLGDCTIRGNTVRFINDIPAAANAVAIQMVDIRNSTGIIEGNQIVFECPLASATATIYGLYINTSALESALDAGTAGAPTSGRLLVSGNRVGTVGGNLNYTIFQTGNNDSDGAGGASANNHWSILFTGNSTFGAATSRHWTVNRPAWLDGTNDVMSVEWGASGQTLAATAGGAHTTVEVIVGTGATTFAAATPLIVGDQFIVGAVTYTVATRTSDTVYTVTPTTAAAAGSAFSIKPTVMVFGGTSTFSSHLKIWRANQVTGITFHRTVTGAQPRPRFVFCAANTYAAYDTSIEPLTPGHYWDGAANKAAGVWVEYNGNTGAFSVITGNGGVSLGVTAAGVPAVRNYGQIEMTLGI